MTETVSLLSAVEQIRQKLQRYPHVQVNSTPTAITASPVSADGFPVRLDERGKRYTVSFSGWHEEFDSQDEAFSCFAFGLSEACRLRVLSRGSFDYRWIVQHYKDGDWHDDSETGLLVFPFWLRRQERYLQNHFTPVI
jgi:hypothetical protein